MLTVLMTVLHSGWLEPDDVRLIPDQLRPEFNVAVDAAQNDDDSTEELSDWRLMYSRAARQYDFSNITGYDGIFRCLDITSLNVQSEAGDVPVV